MEPVGTGLVSPGDIAIGKGPLMANELMLTYSQNDDGANELHAVIDTQRIAAVLEQRLIENHVLPARNPGPRTNDIRLSVEEVL